MRASHLIVLSTALALAACSSERPPDSGAADAVAGMQERLQNLPTDPEAAAAELAALGAEMEDRLAAAQAGAGEAVADACAFLDEADVLALIGAPAKREPMPRMGSSWGGCNYSASEVDVHNLAGSRHLMVNLRPAAEFDDTVAYHRQGGTMSAAAGLDGEAWIDGKALLWQPPGKPWFVFVSGGALGTQDPGFAVDAATRMKF